MSAEEWVPGGRHFFVVVVVSKPGVRHQPQSHTIHNRQAVVSNVNWKMKLNTTSDRPPQLALDYILSLILILSNASIRLHLMLDASRTFIAWIAWDLVTLHVGDGALMHFARDIEIRFKKKSRKLYFFRFRYRFVSFRRPRLCLSPSARSRLHCAY